MTIEELIVKFNGLTTEELLQEKTKIEKNLASMVMQPDAVDSLEAINVILDSREESNE